MGADDTITIAFIGAGAMGGAIARGLVASGAVEASRVCVADPSDAAREAFTALGGRAFADAYDMIDEVSPDVVFIAVKPQILPKVVQPVAGLLDGRLVVSIAAGVSLATLEQVVGHGRLVRVMPNLPMAHLSGAAAVCAGPSASQRDVDLVCALLGNLGAAKVMREDQLDVEGAVVGCGPAYFALFVDALTRAAVKEGMPAADARDMVVATMLGTARTLAEEGVHPRAYMERVTSPGGTTAAALEELEPCVMEGAYAAVAAALDRTRELAEASGR